MTVLPSSTATGKDYGNVELGEDQKILSFREESENLSTQLINAGVYCLNKELIKDQPVGNTSLERDWFPQWLCDKRVLGMVSPKSFYDIGTSNV